MTLLSLVGLLVALLFIGVPIAMALGLSSLAALLTVNVPLLAVPQRVLYGADHFSLLAIPFFMMAGALMNSGGLTRRLVSFASALVGQVRGGLSFVVVLTNMFMAGISGSSAADASATGAVLIPAMNEKGYPRGFSAAVTAAASTIGPIIPPSILMVVFSSQAGAPVGRLFLAGALPGIVMGICLMVVCYFLSTKYGYARGETTSLRKILSTFKDALPALIMPVIIVGGILGGIFTATEAAAVAVVCALIIGLFVYRELSVKDLPRIFKEVVISSAGILFVIAVSSLFAWVLTREQVPQILLSLLTRFSFPVPVTLMLIVVALLFIGCFMDTSPMIVILTPVLLPVVRAMGIDLIHFGVVMVMAVCLGVITPPVGVSAYIVASIARISIEEYTRYLIPFFVALVAAVFIAALWPELSLFLPNLIGGAN